MPKPYEGVGFFEEQWRNPPRPFNPEFDPGAHARWKQVTKSMEEDDFYASHTREECKSEWRRRYDEFKARDSEKMKSS